MLDALPWPSVSEAGDFGHQPTHPPVPGGGAALVAPGGHFGDVGVLYSQPRLASAYTHATTTRS